MHCRKFALVLLESYLSGQVFAIFVLTVSAAEAAVGLAIVIALYRSRKTVDIEKLNLLKW
ncbi:MAG: NADH-quinone oxidoreductase subunit K [Cyanobacteria bacterium]|nr:NADH-quinone oxidoreductase subunit K [Cyanobacteriota bacterium]